MSTNKDFHADTPDPEFYVRFKADNGLETDHPMKSMTAAIARSDWLESCGIKSSIYMIQHYWADDSRRTYTLTESSVVQSSSST